MNTALVYLIPTVLYENATEALPAYIVPAIERCQIFFVENKRTARRNIKLINPNIVIDDYEWIAIEKAEEQVLHVFRESIRMGKTVGIISEAGCPGVADPGQLLVAAAQELHARVVPLVGPNSILLALMASGLNGQQFSFAGYLPIDNHQRIKAIKELELASRQNNCTQIFIETPYRNNQMIDALLKTCHPATKLCVAVNLTGSDEWIKTRLIKEWKHQQIDLHKKPAIFLLKA